MLRSVTYFSKIMLFLPYWTCISNTYSNFFIISSFEFDHITSFLIKKILSIMLEWINIFYEALLCGIAKVSLFLIISCGAVEMTNTVTIEQRTHDPSAVAPFTAKENRNGDIPSGA